MASKHQKRSWLYYLTIGVVLSLLAAAAVSQGQVRGLATTHAADCREGAGGRTDTLTEESRPSVEFRRGRQSGNTTSDRVTTGARLPAPVWALV